MVSHEVKRCRRGEASLILVGGSVACSHYLTALHRIGRRSPSVVVVFRREEIIEGDTCCHILQTQLRQLEVVRQVHIRCEVSVEHHANIYGVAVIVQCLVVLEACVRDILLAHILTLDAGIEALILKGEDVVGNPVGREGQRLVAKISHGLVGQRHGDILDTVL